MFRRSLPRGRIRPAPLFFTLLLAGAAARAGDGPVDDWSLWLGAYDTTSDTTLWARGEAGDYAASGRLNLERDLGLGRRQPVAQARLETRLGESQGLALEYFGFERSNTATLAREFTWDGRTYEANAELRGQLAYDFASATWRWWLGEGETRLAPGLGLAYYRVDTAFEGRARLDDLAVEGRTASSDHAFAPLLSLAWRHALAENVRVYAEFAGVAKPGGALAGHIVDTQVGLEWFPFRRLGLALEYGGTQIRLDRRRAGADGSLEARLDLKLHGPSLLLRLR